MAENLARHHPTALMAVRLDTGSLQRLGHLRAHPEHHHKLHAEGMQQRQILYQLRSS